MRKVHDMLTKKQLQSLNLLRNPTFADKVSGYVVADAVQTVMAEIEALQTTIGNLQAQNLQAAMEAAEWKFRAMAAAPEIERLQSILTRIAAVDGCECDTFEGHVCMLCKVRAMAEEARVTE